MKGLRQDLLLGKSLAAMPPLETVIKYGRVILG